MKYIFVDTNGGGHGDPPLWIPAFAGMTKGAGMTFCIILYILQQPFKGGLTAKGAVM